MNEQTTQLIEDLAKKLGTTVEYLWSVLLNQAFVSATTDLILSILFIINVVIVYRLHKYYSKPYKESSSYCRYDELEESCPIMILTGLVALLGIIYVIFNIDNIITGYLNPEYWALSRILNVIS